ncbi:hypothetical protein [Plasmodium yoelii yoelii]|uniref:Uncharacterized protein n=1 Tax=Plasmodium yoelii yoelii TaxID=73239 RepID=Q7RJH5_PLAYO|nr:hypothetical protein [Plasmodium yoelii yoelii]
MIKQRYRNVSKTFKGHFHALFSKVEISPNTTMIAYASADINDQNSTIQEINGNGTSINGASLESDNNSQEKAITGVPKQKAANIFGFLVKKEDNHVKITHISSINENIPFSHNYIIQILNINYYQATNIKMLKNIILVLLIRIDIVKGTF